MSQCIKLKRDPIDGLDVVVYRDNGEYTGWGEVNISGVSLASDSDIRHAIECELDLPDGALDNVVIIDER